MIINFFRRSILWEPEERLWFHKLRNEVSPDITEVNIERVFYVDSSRLLRPEELEILCWLMRETFEPTRLTAQTQLNGQALEVGPRINRITPYSTNAVSICQACGLDSITRFEEARRFQIVLQNGAQLSSGQRERIYALIHDRMTETPYPNPLATFDLGIKPEPVRVIPVLKEGAAALRAANKMLGTAFSEQMMDYIIQYYRGIGRDPTDVELFGFGQLNSEHCRHHLFNGTFVIDGQVMPYSLFEMIKATTAANPGNVLVAYKDNAAVISGKEVLAFLPEDPSYPSPYVRKRLTLCLTFKVETHNHPTAIFAFSGAGTGTGGVIRDPLGTGRGGYPVATLACYYTSNPFIPGYILPWERSYAPHPGRLQTALEIAIQASNGASDYGNKYGLPLINGSLTTFDQMVGEEHYGWTKTCMVAGCYGLMDKRHVEKLPQQKGYLVVQIGGDGYRIGLGGGSGSSKDAGAQGIELDFDSVQREDPEMGNRENSVIRACSELGEMNPIIDVTDLGAGGESVGPPELISKLGGWFELRDLPVGDKTMAVYVVWGNEAQERMVMVIRPEGLALFRQICERYRCPMAVIGKVSGDGKLTLTDRNASADAPREEKTPIDLDMGFLLADLPKMTINCQRKERQLRPLEIPGNLTIRDALDMVLRLPKVASKGWLTHKVDRSVGGLVARQQEVGPLQLPLADCAAMALSFFTTKGMATATGEQPIKGLVDTRAGGRMSLGESLTNLVGAPVDDFDSINFSATWQWPCGQPGENARLYETVEAVSKLCIDLKPRIPVGKDSVSMTAWTIKDGQDHAIKAPGTVQIVSFAPCPDITKVLTPDIKRPGESRLMFVDLSGGKYRLGGSAFAQVLNQIGDKTPDVDYPQLLRRGFEAIQMLNQEGLILSVHDRSDGGLVACLAEMAFAGNCGLDIDLAGCAGLGIDSFSLLFAEELGLTIEYLPENDEILMARMRQYGLNQHYQIIGEPTTEKTISIRRGKEILLSEDMRVLRGIWQETSYQFDLLQANPECVADEREHTYDRPGPNFHLSFTPKPTPRRISKRYKVAVLEDEGTNGQIEMGGAFEAAGFEVYPVHMTDLTKGKISLEIFHGIAIAGGFSFSDVPDAGKGLAAVAKFNARIDKEFRNFFARPDTFSLGVCNGCQFFALMGWVPWPGIPDDKQPRFVQNLSRRFESRWSAVKILNSPAIMLKGMADSVLGIWVAHGEGRLYFPEPSMVDEVVNAGLVPMAFVDDAGELTEEYPLNPNGSPYGIAGLCTPDGRHLAMMPHPERTFLKSQWSWMPEHLNKKLEASPWLQMFRNAKDWCDKTR